MTIPVLHTQGVTKSFGDHVALSPLDVEVQEGRIVGLLGPNGAGKTTLLRMVTGITKPDAGELRMWGQPHHRKLLARMGYLPEERGLYKSMRVAEQVLYFATLRGMARPDAERELKGWFERLEVEGWWNREVADLSKGMAQKIQFIATVLHRPELLILDEPFSGLDPINAALVRGEMMRLVKDNGTTLVLSTHDMGSVEALCDEVILLHQGKKVLAGPTDVVREDARRGRIRLAMRGNLMAFVAELGARAELLSKSTRTESVNASDAIHDLDIALPENWPMPSFLAWALGHVDVLEAVPLKLSMEEVFVQSVESASS